MIATVVLGLVNLFCTGILAGEELVIYYGVRTPLASLDERPQTLLRQALIRRLRILVPAIFVPSILLGVAVTVLGGFGPGFGFHVAGVLALLTWTSATLPGTASINAAVLGWDPSSLPENWASSGRPVGAIRLCASLGGDGCVCSVLDSHSVVASNGKSSKPAWQGFLGFLRIDLVPVVLVSVVPVVPRSSCVISSWLQYF